MAVKSYRQQSRTDWGTEEEKLTIEQIQTGAFLRIADAVEIIAKDNAQLIRERDQYKQWYEQKRKQVENLENRLRTQKGLTTRYRNQVATLKEQLK